MVRNVVRADLYMERGHFPAFRLRKSGRYSEEDVVSSRVLVLFLLVQDWGGYGS